MEKYTIHNVVNSEKKMSFQTTETSVSEKDNAICLTVELEHCQTLRSSTTFTFPHNYRNLLSLYDLCQLVCFIFIHFHKMLIRASRSVHHECYAFDSFRTTAEHKYSASRPRNIYIFVFASPRNCVFAFSSLYFWEIAYLHSRLCISKKLRFST